MSKKELQNQIAFCFGKNILETIKDMGIISPEEFEKILNFSAKHYDVKVINI